MCIHDLYVYTTMSMCILQSLCVYYNLYVHNLYVYTSISMCILRSLCVYYNLYVYTAISMFILQSLCVYYNIYVYTTISMCILQSLCVYYNLYVYTSVYYDLYDANGFMYCSLDRCVKQQVCDKKCIFLSRHVDKSEAAKLPKF